MRIAAHHKTLGDQVTLSFGILSAQPSLFERPDKIYASLIFEKTKPKAYRLLETRPDALIGGSGWNLQLSLQDVGITTSAADYSLWPRFRHSIGFTQRGCRLRCPFCIVPVKEGAARPEQTVAEIFRDGQKYYDGKDWRPCPRELLLLDNDFFGQQNWPAVVDEIRRGDFKVCFNQGINARMLNDESAEALASMRCTDDQFKIRRIYTAWDNRRDQDRLFAGLNALVRHGFKPDQIMVFMLIGYWTGESEDDWLYRQKRLREFGARPYPMPFDRRPETIGFQRFVIGAYDKRFDWYDWKRARFRPERLGALASNQLDLCGASDATGQ
jgi:hypothetical protein